MSPTFLRNLIRNRPHLTIAIVAGVAVGWLWPGDITPLQRALIGWNGGAWPYLVSMFWMMARADAGKVRAIAGREDENAGLILGTLVVGALMSVSAIVTELARLDHPSSRELALRYAFTGVTVLGSWLLVGVLFTFHYAHLYYRSETSHSPPGRRPLRFPDEHVEPNYWDFMYFAFTIAVACQTSDVEIGSRAMRKLALGQSVLAFFFNLSILGLSINLAASVINS
jgi:uncharacterized membrane protein